MTDTPPTQAAVLPVTCPDDELADGVHRSTMAELADWTVAAAKVLVW